MEQGLVHIYCGDGVGKTTASVGLAVRAAGRGLRVLFTQFLKSGDTGELFAMETIPGITVYSGAPVEHFLWEMDDQEMRQTALRQEKQLAAAFAMACEEAYDMLVLDEIIPAVGSGLIAQDRLILLLRQRSKPLEVVLTGRGASGELCAVADYVSEIREVKHPYQQGICARAGIEY